MLRLQLQLGAEQAADFAFCFAASEPLLGIDLFGRGKILSSEQGLAETGTCRDGELLPGAQRREVIVPLGGGGFDLFPIKELSPLFPIKDLAWLRVCRLREAAHGMG